ncbi:RNA polymerase sigma factor [Pleionea sp. CnH1-48]|uniref:RNA polymerase sigma factor n=1 Tax=Pleionea sp. CnH1-48 TaxID=2954494 RepID=UPI0020968334|nr:RNA polymerase sigma factor [Pleionea sp. CnH1-48]MCO7225122.1 RNA polymerase sigma factor [Pleionea sp. CnH1-48]
MFGKAVLGFGEKVAHTLIDRARKGDLRALEVIYDTYANACFSLAYRISDNYDLAQDITQDVFIKVMTGIRNFRGYEELGGWVRRIVSNETINRIRSTQRLHLVGEDEYFYESDGDLFNNNWLESCQDLDKLLAKLPMNSRAVLLLHEVEGFNHKEIARMFDKSESFSKVTLSRAFAQLRKYASQQKREPSNAFKR